MPGPPAKSLMDEFLIRQVPLFASLPDEDLARLAATLPRRDFPHGMVLFREGEAGDRFYVVLAGQIEVIKALGTGEERLLGVRGPGEFVGEMSLINPDGLRTATVRTRTDARALELSRADFNALLHRYPTLGYEMVRVLSMRLNAAHNTTIRDMHEKNRLLAEANEQLRAALADLQAAQAKLLEKAALERELAVAREIQQSILPRALPALAGFDFGARMLPARAVGGDFYDFIPLGQDRLGIAVGDVSDKGVPAALFMALTCSLLRAEAPSAGSPAEVLCNVNRHLLGMNAAGMFVTVLYGVLDAATRGFTFVRAGHELPVVLDARGQPVASPEGKGLILGFFPDPSLDEQVLAIPPGGALLLNTDGVTDAANGQGDHFGRERLQRALSDHRRAPAQAVCDRVLEEVAAFAGPAPQFDDLTVVAVQALSDGGA